MTTEKKFTTAVIDLAHIFGWRVAHFRAARTAKGWRTAVQGDGRGFPDLLLIRRQTLIVAELKVGQNKPSMEQREWLDEFAAAGVKAYVWRPDDWSDIVDILQGEQTSSGGRKTGLEFR